MDFEILNQILTDCKSCGASGEQCSRDCHLYQLKTDLLNANAMAVENMELQIPMSVPRHG